jgi:DNA-binding PadR family transcriptional regulator
MIKVRSTDLDVYKRTVNEFRDVLWLKFLAEEGEASAYSFLVYLNTNYHVLLSSGNIYASVRVWQLKGFVKGRRMGRAVVFRLTDKGRKELAGLQACEDGLVCAVLRLLGI